MSKNHPIYAVAFVDANHPDKWNMRERVIDVADSFDVPVTIHHVNLSDPKCVAYKVRALPTVVLLDYGAECARLVGEGNLYQLFDRSLK